MRCRIMSTFDTCLPRSLLNLLFNRSRWDVPIWLYTAHATRVAMRSSHPVFLLITFYLLLNITYALPANSLPSLQLQNTTAATANESLSIPTVTTPLHAGRSVECFAPDTPVTASVTVEDCEFVFEAILRDPAGVMAMTKFTHTPGLFEYGVPAHWYVFMFPPKSMSLPGNHK